MRKKEFLEKANSPQFNLLNSSEKQEIDWHIVTKRKKKETDECGKNLSSHEKH